MPRDELNLCSDGHDEICFADQYKGCPACQAIGEMQETIDEKDKEIEGLNEQIAALECGPESM